MSVVRCARLVEDEPNLNRMLAAVRSDAVGGIALFVGIVRDVDHSRPVQSLDYTAHPNAEQTLTRCAELVAARHDVLAVAVEHRVGHLEIGDVAVVVAVGAAHRGPALAACHQLIDDLKAQVPIWKEQTFTSGDTEWVGLP